jgi:hypothetical protein
MAREIPQIDHRLTGNTELRRSGILEMIWSACVSRLRRNGVLIIGVPTDVIQQSSLPVVTSFIDY